MQKTLIVRGTTCHNQKLKALNLASEFHHSAAGFPLCRFNLPLAPDAGFFIKFTASQFCLEARFLAFLFEALQDALNRFIFLHRHKVHLIVSPLSASAKGIEDDFRPTPSPYAGWITRKNIDKTV